MSIEQEENLLSLYECSLDELKKIGYESWYNDELSLLGNSKIATTIKDKYYGRSIAFLSNKIDEEERKIVSEEFFPGEKVIMYPWIKEQIARQSITCDFSAGIIRPGSLYVRYRPLFYLIDSGETFVLKRTIRVEDGYHSDLPTTLEGLESLYIKAKNEARDNSGIEYSHFWQTMGEDFSFTKLNRRKK